MSETIENRDYYAFLRWFQETHPEMYLKYGQQVNIPLEWEGINISRGNIDPTDYERLVQIESDYSTSGR